MNQQGRKLFSGSVIQDLSHCRGTLMGAAIVWVVLYHLEIHLSGGLAARLINKVLVIGYGGTDLFFFLSGFGLAFALEKDSRFFPYVKRRLQKLIPAYYPVILVYALLQRGQITFAEVLGNLGFFGMWAGMDHQFNWYLQAAMLFYLLAPAMGWFLKKLGGGLVPLALLLAASAMMVRSYLWQYPIVAAARLPVFILGYYLGTRQRSGLRWSWAGWLLTVAALAAGVIVLDFTFADAIWETGWLWFPFILIAPALCLLAAWLRPWYSKLRLFAWLDQGLGFLGKCSLEIYLIHILILNHWRGSLPSNFHRLLLGFGCILLGIAYHYLVEFARKKLSGREKQNG